MDNAIKAFAGKIAARATRTIALALALSACALSGAMAQEALLSTAENYYDLESLFGNAERPYLNYKTLSDSRWILNDRPSAIWDGVNLGSSGELAKGVTFRAYGPELFSSYNSAAPYGQNDGALWQGKGANSSLSAGARVEGYGLELTLKPQVAFSQNRAFDLVAPAYSGSSFAGKGDTYGYYGIQSVDAPQRFGDDPFWTFSWGDSEVRYSWKTLTVGFGTQSIWLGPARINPILHSNNAPSYPKLDVGMRKQEIVAFGRDLGYAEARLWCGYLSESDYFDNDGSNDHSMISGLSFAYAPSLFEGLTLFANRVYLSKWESESFETIPRLFMVSLAKGGAQDVWDQRVSLGFDYLLPRAEIEVYGEAGINDYAPSLQGYIRYPFHSMVYTAGIRKGIALPTASPMRLEALFEWTNLEMSQDFQFQWPSTFYAHHQITQGYTNGGQWLGAGNGTGGNSQYLGFRLWYPKGYTNLFVHRQNPDNDCIYAIAVNGYVPDPDATEHIKDFKAVLAVGLDSGYWFSKNLFVKGGLAWILVENPLYDGFTYSITEKERGFRMTASASWSL